MRRAIVLFALLLTSARADASDASSRESTLVAFVHGSWEHGIPYTEARTFVAELPRLRAWLKADSMRSSWATIVIMIGYIGQPEDFNTLKDFLENRFTGEVDDPAFQAGISSVAVLGHIAISSKPAMSYLKSGTNPAFFRHVRWTYGAPSKELHLLLSKLAINALSSTGTAEAEKVLVELLKKPYDDAQHYNITEGIERNRRIMVVGRETYFQNAGLSAGPTAPR